MNLILNNGIAGQKDNRLAESSLSLYAEENAGLTSLPDFIRIRIHLVGCSINSLRIHRMKVLFASILLCFSGMLTLAQTKSPSLPSPQGELLNLITSWNEAELKGDAAEVAKLLAPEFSFLGGSDRKQYLSLMKPDPSLVIESATINDAEIQVYENSAVVTSLNSFKLKKDGRPLEGKFLSLTIWIRRDGNWQCVKASLQKAKE
ncbi:MAG TPA: nuclear transport factor 2 family protein [Pyrinomonadaceae bacterium]|jgi:hypothetical protein|nr:nuclear transport factor 2 family protein [Pyrinomonadaceae bacterium]